MIGAEERGVEPEGVLAGGALPDAAVIPGRSS
jgi:hypothetical protein